MSHNLLIWLPALPLVVPVFLPFFLSEWGACLRAKMFGYKIAKCDNGGSETWKTPVMIGSNGKLYGYRYPATKIGDCSFDEATKKGYYCGRFDWDWA